MNSRVLRYILDLEAIFAEMEALHARLEGSYHRFEQDAMAIRALERHFEIIGEAVNKLQQADPAIRLEHAKAIIGLRNLIAHAYDAVDNAILWSILINHIPRLKEEIRTLRSVG